VDVPDELIALLPVYCKTVGLLMWNRSFRGGYQTVNSSGGVITIIIKWVFIWDSTRLC